jgi:hypothetical protein
MLSSARRLAALPLALALVAFLAPAASAGDPPPGFVSLFNGKDLTGWKIPAGDGGHWKVVDGVIDYDAQSEAEGDKSLYTEKEFGDYVLRADWRISDTPYVNPRVKIVLPSGDNKKGPDGKDVDMAVPDSDSGIFMRGVPKAQVNIWCWPVGSGEVYGYRNDKSMPPEVRAGVVPSTLADNNIGEWNTFEITMKGDRLTVVLNGEKVLDEAQLPGITPRGPLGLQHHGGKGDDGKWNSPPALVQFKNIYIKELK